jgi:uncharacterized membrane protein YphA (DoxX/SURF4 family)
MERLVRIGRLFYAINIAGLAGQQLYYSDFRPVFVPPWPTHIPGQAILAWIFSFMLIGAAVALVLEKKARTVMLLLGGLLLLLFLFCHVPYEMWVNPGGGHIGAWSHGLKDLSIAGGAFMIAGSFPQGQGSPGERAIVRPLEAFIPLGGIFYSIMLIVFGIDHFLYVEFVKSLVPDWIPGHLFWTYLAAIALIGSGVAIILRIRVRQIGILLGITIFIWFLILHIPRAAVAPASDNGNELSSVFESLGSSGIAFVAAYVYGPRLRIVTG